MSVTNIDQRRPIITDYGVDLLESMEREICESVNARLDNGMPGHLAASVLEQLAFQLRLNRTDDEAE